jgi:hypothetical protein
LDAKQIWERLRGEFPVSYSTIARDVEELNIDLKQINTFAKLWPVKEYVLAMRELMKCMWALHDREREKRTLITPEGKVLQVPEDDTYRKVSTAQTISNIAGKLARMFLPFEAEGVLDELSRRQEASRQQIELLKAERSRPASELDSDDFDPLSHCQCCGHPREVHTQSGVCQACPDKRCNSESL